MKAVACNQFLTPSRFLILGLLVGVLVVFDNYITTQLNIEALNTGFLRRYPVKLSTLLFLLIPVLVFVKKNFDRIAADSEKKFIFVFLFCLQIPSLTTMGKIDLSELVLIGFFVIFLVKHMVRPDHVRLSGLDLLNLIFVMFVLLSSVNGGLSCLVRASITMIKFLLLVFLIVNVVRNKENLIFLLKWMVIMTAVSSIIAIGQEIVYLLTGIPIVGIVEKDTMRFMIEATPLGNFLRVPAFFGSYKPFTFYVNLSMIILFNYFIYKGPFERKRTTALVSVFFLMLTALLLTFSKDGLLSVAVGLVLSLIFWRPYLIVHLCVGTLAVIAVVSALGLWDDIGNSIVAELSYGEQRTRIQLAREGISGLVHKNTWLGVGVGNGVRYTGHFFGWSAHNALIQAADEVGLVGLLAYIALLFYTFLHSIKFNIARIDISDTWIVRSMFAGFVATLITIQFHPFFIEKFVWLVMAIMQAVTLIVFKQKAGASKYHHA